MKLHEFLDLIIDEDAKIELQNSNDESTEPIYFWLSDYREDVGDGITFKDCIIKGFTFMPFRITGNVDIAVIIEQN